MQVEFPEAPQARATYSGAPTGTASGFRRRRPKSGHRSSSPRSPRRDHSCDSGEGMLPEAIFSAPVVVEAPTSLSITTECGTERVMPHTWLVLDSTTTLEAGLNCLAPDAGGGTITEGGERLQQVSDDRLNATGAEANFQRCSRSSSLASLRHAAVILTLFGNREGKSKGIVPMGPTLLAHSASREVVKERARRVESIVAFRAATASQRPRPGTVQNTPRTARLPSVQGTPRPGTVSQRSPRQSVMQKGLQALEDFTSFAEHKFGNTVRAWFMLDPEARMTIGEKQFARACDEIGFRGNVIALWRYLDSDQSGHITILELDAPAAISLAELKLVIRERFMDSASACFSFMDDNRSDRLFKDEFVRSMKQFGFKASSSARLFGMFDRQRLQCITSKDIVFLDRWNPPPYLFSRPDTVGLENFKSALRNIFVSLLRAWKQLLDKDGTMRVSWDEFCDTCKYLQKKSMMHGLPKTEAQQAAIWRALDEDCGGWIALREFDQESFESVAKFKTWSMENHGSVAHSFQALTTHSNAKLHIHELLKIEDMMPSESHAKLLIQGLNMGNNFTNGTHLVKGKTMSIQVPFLVEKDVRFLDKWDLEWEEQERLAQKT